MKYWRGYLVAAIVAAFTFALEKFAQAHVALVDMFYPYVTRMMQTFLAGWSSNTEACLWQVLLIILGVVVLATAVLMIVFKWNPIQWFGWVLTGVSIVFLLNTGIYGLNAYSGPISEDIRMQEADYTVTDLQKAAEYFRDEAGKLTETVARDTNGNVKLPGFDVLAKQAGEGFQVLTKEQFKSVFAGSTVPVKKLGWSGYYSSKGVAGKHVAITGEAAVNPDAPSVYLPYAMCQQMARRMSIAIDRDVDFAAFLACIYNPDPNFQYTGYLIAYNECVKSLQSVAQSTGDNSVLSLTEGVDQKILNDIASYEEFLGKGQLSGKMVDLLVSWHIQEKILPLMQEEQVRFDPMDETQVDLSGLPNAVVPETSGAADE